MGKVNITFPGNLGQVDSVADLRSVPSYFLPDGLIYVVKLAGRSFTFDTSATGADDGLDIVKPNDLTAAQAGRWLYAIDGIAPGPEGPAGPADNTYTSYAALLASDPSRKVARLAADPPDPSQPNGNFTYQNGAWVRQEASGIAYGLRSLNATLDETIYVENYREPGFSDLQTWRAAISAWLTAGKGKLVAGRGRSYNLGAKSDVSSVFSITAGLVNAEIDLNGSATTIKTTADDAGHLPIYNVFDIGNYTNLTIRNGRLLDTGYVSGVIAGACWITPQPGSQTCLGLTIDNIATKGGLVALQPKGPSANGRIDGVHIVPNCVFENVYYGLNCQEQGDNITGGYTTINALRGYFVYGCSNHDVTVSMQDDGEQKSETFALIKRYTRDTTNISLWLKPKGIISARNALVKLEHQNDQGASSVIDNISVDIDLDRNTQDPNGVARLGFRSYSDSGVENVGVSAHVTSNVRLGGDLIGSTTGALSFTAATTNGSAIIAPSGLFPGQVMDYFAVGARITGPGIPADTIVAGSDGSTVSLSNPATATASAAALVRSPVDVRSHYTPAKEIRIALDPAIKGATPSRVSAYRGFAWRVARDREYRLFRGDLTTAGLPIDLSGLDNVSTMINVGIMALGNQSGASSQDRTFYEFNVFLTIPPGGPIAVNATPNPTNNSTGTAAGFSGFSVSGKQLAVSLSGAGYATATSFARIDTTYRDQVPA